MKFRHVHEPDKPTVVCELEGRLQILSSLRHFQFRFLLLLGLCFDIRPEESKPACVVTRDPDTETHHRFNPETSRMSRESNPESSPEEDKAKRLQNSGGTWEQDTGDTWASSQEVGHEDRKDMTREE